MVQAMKDGDRYWALPTVVRSLAIFYNERLFEDAGIAASPATLEELADTAAKLTKRDGAGNITQVGLTAGMTAQDHHWFREGLIRQMGGQPYVDDYRTANYDTEAGVAALKFYTDMFMPEEPVTAIGFLDEPQAAFKVGRAGMHIDGSFRIGSLDGTRGLEWGVAELPARASVGMTDADASDAVYGPFFRGLEYAHTAKFANESGQRQLMVEMVERVQLEGMNPAKSLAIAAQAEQKILGGYYGE